MSLAVSLLAIFAVIMMVIGSLARVGSPRLAISTACKAGWLIAPFATATAICVALLEPGLLQQACHCVAHGLHHPHLCLRHPDYAEAILLPTSLVAGAWTVLAVPKVVLVLRDIWNTWRWSRSLLETPVQVFDSIQFRLIDAPGLGAFTTGLLRPFIAVDSSLWGKLNDEERRAVLHHENAHRARRDPLSLVVLRICAALAVIPGLGLLLGKWQAQAEQECDRHAVEVVGSPESVASALLCLERYHRDQRGALVPMVASGAGADLERRVRTLLDDDGAGMPANLASDIVRLSLVSFGVSVAFTLLAGDLVHHGAETVLGLLTHHHLHH
jgi:Zn-dependent protease with chaperone function